MSPVKIMWKYRKRIVQILERMADVLRQDGYVVEGPTFLDGDDYRWSLLVHLDGDPDTVSDQDIDISIKLCESEEYDGTEGGVNFSVDIVEVSGRILGGLTPFNYSDRCWVSRNDPQAVEERFRIVEEADEYGVLHLLSEHQRR